MSILEVEKIDFISIDKKSQRVILSISDHLEFDEKNEHLIILQNKVNAYLGAIETGQILKSYPKARGKNYEIRIYFQYSPTDECIKFLKQVMEILSEKNILLSMHRL